MHRFFLQSYVSSSERISIIDISEVHHLKNVLRLKKGDSIYIFNGQGDEGSGVITMITSQKVDLNTSFIKKNKLNLPKIILACAIPKKSKFEMIIEKATELGVDEIIPLKTKRTEININDDRAKKKLIRYQTVALNASKQSQRSIIPKIHPITKFSDIFQNTENINTQMIMPSLCNKRKNLIDVFEKLKDPKSIIFLIGPEGDFTPEEYELAWSKGAIPVTLGQTILKVETAALCTLSGANLYYHAPKC